MGFLFVGNRLCLDFVNTRVMEHGHPVDYLRSGADVRRWLKAAGVTALSTGTKSRHQQLLREARVLRGAVEGLAARLAAGRPAPRSSVAALNRVLRARREHLQLVRAGGRFHTARQSEAGDTLGSLAPVALSAARLLTEDDPSRVRRCGNPACVLYFYDTTRSRTRRWCSMQGCGNRLKVAAHRRRTKRR